MGRSLGYMVVPFLGECDKLGASGEAFSTKVPFFFDTFAAARRYSTFTDLVKNQSTGVE